VLHAPPQRDAVHLLQLLSSGVHFIDNMGIPYTDVKSCTLSPLLPPGYACQDEQWRPHHHTHIYQD